MLDLLETVFLALISVAVPALMLGLTVLIFYAIYREVRSNR
jgi:hypothetical protein